jgi:Ca2+-binding EF-hand superfamily protein
MNTTMKLIAAASVLAFLAGPCATLAQDRPDGERMGRFAQRMIERYDADKNGSVTLEEYLSAEDDRFERADGDDDGFVTMSELQAAMRSHGRNRGGRMLNRLDADEDGRVSLAEAEEDAGKRVRRLFKRIDANEDGFITEAEIESARERRASRWEKRLAERVDTDRDGRISSAEAETARKARFARIDVDNNGTVTVAELTERFRKHRRGKRRN